MFRLFVFFIFLFFADILIGAFFGLCVCGGGGGGVVVKFIRADTIVSDLFTT